MSARIAVASPCYYHSDHWAATGPYGVGVITTTIVDPTRATPANGSYPGAPDRTLVTEVWYPSGGAPGVVERDAPISSATGAFPLVVSSHGFFDSRTGLAYVATHLASRGFVVAAPDFPLSHGGAPGGATVVDLANQPGDVAAVIDGVLAAFGTAIDDARIGLTGLSLGGSTTLLATFHPRLRDPRVRAALPIAPGACFFTKRVFRTTNAPLLLLHGDGDLLLPFAENALRAYHNDRPPHTLVRVKNGSHVGFSGFATLLDPSMHYDLVGCQVLTDIPTEPLPGLGTKRDGIDQNPRKCSLPCRTDPTGPALDATRQLELTRIVAAAFFEATLAKDLGADCFIEHFLEEDNPELAVKQRGRLSRPLLR
jgi:predicted dienelactone hydrolase